MVSVQAFYDKSRQQYVCMKKINDNSVSSIKYSIQQN